MQPADLSIVILTKNGGELFDDVLAGLFRCDGILETEVLMIDSGSTDGTLERAARYPHIRVHAIPPAEFGHGRTRNLGVRLTSRPIVVFLVQDATPATPDFLARLTAPLAEPGIVGVYARQLPRPWTNRVEKMFLGQTYPDKREIRAWRGGPMGIRDMFFSNVCSAIQRAVLVDVPFDEQLIMSEDQLWAKQALQRGHRLAYEPGACVYHSHNYRLKEVFRRNFDSGVSLVGVAEDSLPSMVKYELRHIASGVGDLVGSGDAFWLPYFFAYEATRAAAFACGQRAHLLKPWMKRRLSLHRYHWDER